MCDIEDEKQDAKEKILLLEFLVETLEIDHHILNSQPELKLGKTAVHFSILDLPPLEFNEEVLPIGRSKKGADSKNGKSCLFSLPDFPSIPEGNLEVNIQVIRELPPCIIPSKVPIAKTSIDLSSLYQTLVKETRAHPYCLPITKAHKECYLLTNLTGTRIAGSIGVFMRASCFGKIIVSQFRLNSQECLFQGSPQGIHPLMYELAGIPKRPPDAKDIFPYDSVPPQVADSIVGDISAGVPPQDGEEKYNQDPDTKRPSQQNALPSEGPRTSKVSGKENQNPERGSQFIDPGRGSQGSPQGLGVCCQGVSNDPVQGSAEDSPGKVTVQRPSAFAHVYPNANNICGRDCVCQGPRGPVINMEEEGPGESFYVQRDTCQGPSGGECVCGLLPRVVSPQARKVKELEAKMRGHVLAVRVPKSVEEKNWYELDLNRLFNENELCNCDNRPNQTVTACSRQDFRNAGSEINVHQRNKKCFGTCAESGATSVSPSAQTFISSQYATPATGTTAVNSVAKLPRTSIVSEVPPKIEPAQFSSIREYAGRTDIQVKTPYDPDHDIFVLKITKKGQPPDIKPQLELELRTPKRPIPSPITRLTQEIQYDPNDVKGAAGAGGGKEKGKNKKGKKGKKGKKK